MEKKTRWKLQGVSVAVNLILVLSTVFFFGARYCEDDDITIAWLAYGIYAKASSRTFFSNVVFSKLLSVLGSIFQGINVQLIIYYLLLFLVGSASLYYSIKKGKRVGGLVWLLAIICLFYPTYVYINFTLISATLAFHGFFLLFEGTLHEEKMAIIIGVSSCCLSVLIRIDSFFVVAPFALIIFFLHFLENVKKYKFLLVLKKYVFPFLVMSAMVFILFLVDKLAYREDSWKQFVEYNDDRGWVMDCKSIWGDTEYFDSIGMTPEMVDSFKNWQFNDTEIYNKEVVRDVANRSRNLLPQFGVGFIKHSIKSFIEIVVNKSFLNIGILCLLILIFGTKKKQAWWFALLLLPLIAEHTYYVYLERGLNRVYQASAYGLWLGVMVLACKEDYEVNLKQRFRFLVPALYAMSLVFVIKNQWNNLTDIRGFNLVDTKELDDKYSYLNDGRIYMYDIDAIIELENAYGVWQVPEKGWLSNCIELGGWTVNYPPFLEKQERLGITNPYKDLLYKDNVYLLAGGDGDLQLKYLRSAYDESIQKELVETHGDLSVYKYNIQ